MSRSFVMMVMVVPMLIYAWALIVTELFLST